MSFSLFSYLQELLDQELPFLALRKSGSAAVVVMSQNSQIVNKTAPDTLAYGVFSKFQNNDSQVYIYADVHKEFSVEVPAATSSFSKLSIVPDGQTAYTALFKKAMSELNSGVLKKVVLSRKQEFKKSKKDLQIFEDLLATYPNANGYFFYHPKVGRWIGATPEILLQVEQKIATAMSLAGTAINDGSDTYQWGIKEREEQQIVTDFVVSQFQEVGLEQVTASKTQTFKAGHLLHLLSLIKGMVQKEEIPLLLQALHPTPAVCGLPRNKAYDFIAQHENYDRSYYTGYVGMVHGSSHQYYVNLRCMELLENKAVIYVGGGVTAKSDLQQEYQETNEKMVVMRRLL